MTLSNKATENFPRGTKLTVSFIRETSFGVLVQVLNTEVQGLIESHGAKVPAQYLKSGASFDAVVIDVRDTQGLLKKQIRLSIDPILIANPELLKAEGQELKGVETQKVLRVIPENSFSAGHSLILYPAKQKPFFACFSLSFCPLSFRLSTKLAVRLQESSSS